MKRHCFTIVMCLLLALTLLGGCGNAGGQDVSEKPVIPEKDPATAEEPAAPETPDALNAEAEKAYLDFLGGKGDVTTADVFREDDESGNYDGLLFGTYSYAQLKAAIAEYAMHDSITKYALLDFGQDGVNELALRFESTNPSLMNWTGIIKFSGGALSLNYSYEDGYRTDSALYDSGYLSIGGSFGAGASGYTVVAFDENGFGTDVFSENSYYGTFACGIAYDLQGEALPNSFDEIAGESLLFVREYISGGVVKLSVSDWSQDAAVRAKEEAFISDLVALGAEQISQEEMNQLCSAVPYETEEVEWLDWNDGGDEGQRNGNF